MTRQLFFGSANDQTSGVVARAMTVLETGVYRGPHYYSATPMIRIMLDLGWMEDWPSDRLPAFNERLQALLPGLESHGCCFRERGGFLRRLADGTWMGHVVEHVALELQTLAGTRVTRGKTRSVKGRPGVYNVLFAYEHDELGRAAGRVALETVNERLPDNLAGVVGLDRVYPMLGSFDFDERLEALKRIAARLRYGPTTQSLVDEARRRGIPVHRLSAGSMVQFGHGKHQQRIRASVTGHTSLIAAETAGDKDLTKKLLGENGIPVPRGVVVRSVEDALTHARRLGYPLVTKPLDGNHGRGVTIGISDETQLRFGVAEAMRESRRQRVIVEQFFGGRDHRILVIGGQLVAVAERVPALVIGDGISTIAALVARVNEDPRRGVGHEKVMTRIRIDATVCEFLRKTDLTPDSVPEMGSIVPLRATANLSTGGTAIDRTNEIHPENAEIARRAALVIGLDIAGIDFIAPDIARPVRETGGGVIEVNAAPGFRMHLEPFEGTPRDVAKPVIDLLFPRGRPSRIPIIAITGTNGKSTTARMVKHILRYGGRTVGLTSTSGVYVNDMLISSGDATGPRSARMVLSDPTVEYAVLETARGGLLREGLAFDWADIGAVLNVSVDHLGLKGIDTVDQLASLKSLVVERVRRRGASVLNADDPRTRRMARRAGGEIIWFSLEGGEAAAAWLNAHVERGGSAVVREPGEDGGCIVLHQGARREVVMAAGAIPATLHGMAGFNVANACAAIAIAVAARVPLEQIRSSLAIFQSTFEQNPGRLNVHDEHGFRVILDYAHNPAGLEGLGEVIRGMRGHYQRTIASLSVPGDRRDGDLVEFGRLAAGIFDILFFREDPATRGRPRGEVMRLLSRGAREGGATETAIHCIPGEHEAAQATLEFARSGDLVVITPTDVDGVWQRIREFRPQSHPVDIQTAAEI